MKNMRIVAQGPFFDPAVFSLSRGNAAALKGERCATKIIRRWFWLAVVLCLTRPVLGQVATGTPPFGSFSGSSFDTVNNANLNVHFSIPIISKAGRGMPFSYVLTNDSSIWSEAGGAWTPTPAWGWAGAVQPATGSLDYDEVLEACYWPQNQYGQTYYFNEFYINGYTDTSGTYHPFNIAVSGYAGTPCQNYPFPPESASGSATDNSGFSVQAYTGGGESSLNASVTTTSGTTIVPPLPEFNPSVTDSNGNRVTTSTSGGTTTFTDTLGDAALTISGSNPLTYIYQTTSGPANVSLQYTLQTVETHFGCPNIAEFGASQETQEYLVSEIDLPDGTKYAFKYEATPNPNFPGAVTGRISQVTLPTGGTISYTYINGSNNDGINCSTGSGVYLQRATSPGGTWTYAVTGTAPATTTTVTDPQSNVTVYNFEGIYQTEEQVNQGSNTTLETITTCYNGNTSNCNSTAVSLPITSVAVTAKTSDNLESETVTDYNKLGLPKEVDEYGYGSGAVGPLVRKTVTAYATISGNPNIQDRPSSVAIEDGGNNLKSQISYAYDGNGNLLTLTENVTPSSTLSRSFTYGSYGVLASATDFAGNKTTFTDGDCSGAFPTQVNQPLSLSSLMAWNCNTGLVTSVTDPNSQTTSFSYDELDRLTTTNNPDGGQVSTQYLDTSNPISVETTTVLGAPGNRTDTATLDGLGRVTGTALTSDPVGADKVDTTYDSLGRVASVSNPYRSKSESTYGVTSYTYDALGHVTKVTDPDNNTQQASYGSGSQLCSASAYGLGYPTLTTDEAGHQRRLFTDALGRTIEVDEPDPANGNTLDLNTCYGYDTLGDLTSVVQGSQTRTYSYDMLGRLTQAVTPESGTTTYNYSGCSGDPSNVCSRTDARGITTTYAYDALNRLTQKSYSDGTPTAGFDYDLTTAVINSQLTLDLHNTKGRLAATWVGYPNGTWSDTVYSYDSLGRIIDYWESTPYNWSSSSIWNLHYNYDLAGDVTSWTHPAGFTITNSINTAQQITAMESSLVDSTHPQYLAQSITYMPWGAEQTLENGCAGSGCTNTLETYAYNNRLQPVMIELGTTTNAAADYCLVYGYYTNVNNATSCALNTQGAGDNGNVIGYFYQDAVNPSLSHTALYGYDSLNRLTSAVAVGSSAYNFTFQYDRWGNMTCMINGNTNGPCPEYSFNSANNRISNTGYSYDAAGNLTSDGTNTYQRDAEGRLLTVNGSSNWSASYNALGQVIQRYYAGETDSFVWDPTDHFIANWNQTGGLWDDEYVRSDGRVLADNRQWENTTWILHVDSLGSWRSVTSSGGQLIEDSLLYPWGTLWSYAGMNWAGKFADLPPCCGEIDQSITPARGYSMSEGRWASPDPAGLGAVDPANPQSWNAYAYALNNPTTLTDPSGLCPPCRFKVPMPLPSPGVDEFSYAYPDVLGPEGWEGSALSFGGFAFATSWGNGGYGRGGGFIGGGILDTPMNLAPLGPQPNNGEPASACELANIAAVNAVSNLNVSVNNVVGEPFVFNGGLNVNFSVPEASPSSLPPGRYPSSLFDRVLGIGNSLHVPGPGGADPSTYGIDPATGNFTFTTHIDTAYATWHTPIGVLIHLFVDVRDNGAHRTQCGGAE